MTDQKDYALRVANEATEDWFVYTGKIGHWDQFDANKLIVDFGISSPDFAKLSEDVVAKVKRSTGRSVVLSADWRDQFHERTVADFITALALPGQPTTPAKHPIPLPGQPTTLVGKPTTPASHQSPLPGKKSQT
jgi:hypothetical protein